jgi:excisionase family DNA binding protein
MIKAILLTEQELADLLRVSVKTLQGQRWQKVGIPYLKIGRAVRYRREDIESYLNQAVIKTVQN